MPWPRFPPTSRRPGRPWARRCSRAMRPGQPSTRLATPIARSRLKSPRSRRWSERARQMLARPAPGWPSTNVSFPACFPRSPTSSAPARATRPWWRRCSAPTWPRCSWRTQAWYARWRPFWRAPRWRARWPSCCATTPTSGPGPGRGGGPAPRPAPGWRSSTSLPTRPTPLQPWRRFWAMWSCARRWIWPWRPTAPTGSACASSPPTDRSCGPRAR